MKKKSISIIGLGYIGLPTAAILANKGFSVNGFDINKKIVSDLNNGKIHISESKLNKLLKSEILKGNLKIFNKIQKSKIYIICVPTPFYKSGKIPKPNMNFVFSATKNIAPLLKSGDLVILESTSPLGTTEKIKKKLIENGAKIKNFHVAYCPERVLPGMILKELVENDRVVGGLTREATKRAANFYNSFVKGNIYETDAKTAEMCKLVENSFRDVNIAFANELSMICEKQKINVWNLIKLANNHPRVNILQPGTGVGGHCISVDPWFLISKDIKNTKLIRTAREVNNYKTRWVVGKIEDKIKEYISKTGKIPKIACLGLTFKPDVSDVRESRALEVIENLFLKGYEILVVEPNLNKHKKFSLENFSNAIRKSDIVCVLVKHKKFLKTSNIDILKKCEVLDFCGALN